MEYRRRATHAIERGHSLCGDSELLFQVESVSTGGQLDDVCEIIDGLEGGASVVALYQARDVFIEYGAA